MKTLLIIFSALPAFAAITNIQVSGTTATQAVIAYSAPDASPCRIEVSESPTYAPPVHDVDPSLFPGSNSDSRAGSIFDGRSRLVVIGKHGMTAQAAPNPFLAADGNRYSRALQANTVHYYRITCGSDVATGTFATMNIPLGNTYAEPLAADATTPGIYNWPTVTKPSNRQESFIDPNTGSLLEKVSLPSDSAGGVLNIWPTGGMFQMCSHLMTSSGGHTYNLCDVWSNSWATLVSIETDTGTVYPLSRIVSTYGKYGCTSAGGVGSVHFSPTDAMTIYFTSDCGSGYGQRIYSARWTGALSVAQSVAASPNINASLIESVITPTGIAPLLAAFDPSYDSTQRTALNYINCFGVQNGKLLLVAMQNQDGIGWVFVFDPGNGLPIGSGGTGGVVAANPFWKGPVSRWCSVHTLLPAGDTTPWVHMGSNSLGTKYVGNWGGPYYVIAANNAGTGNTIQIAPTNGSYQPQSSYAPAYLQDAQVGDVVWSSANWPYSGETMEITNIDNVTHTWTVIRGDNLGASKFLAGSDVTPIVDPPVPITAGMRLYMGCRATSFSARVGQNGGEWYWNYEADPHGTSIAYPAVNGTTSNQVVENYVFGGHLVSRDSVNIMDGWNRWDYPSSTPGYDLVSFYNGAASNTLNPNPSFAGVQPPGAIDTYQSHPSFDQMAASTIEKQWFVDAVPLTNESDERVYSASGILTGGLSNTYKMMPGLAGMHTKFLTPIASCGAHPLVNISSPATGNVISDSTPYTYCVANASNECRAGSSAGDVFVSCTGAQNLTCNTNVNQSVVDICIGDSWAYANGAVQVSSFSRDPNGAGTRLISQLFATHHNEDIYNNVRPTADGRWLLFGTSNPTETMEAYMAKLPPFPAAESTRRDTFIPIGVRVSDPTKPSVPGGLAPRSGRPAGTNAIVEFGYAENGDPEAFYCTTRREPCVAQGSSIDVSQPFYYGITEASAIRGMRCSLGCTITIPALAGRVLYYRVTFRDSQGQVVAQGQTGVRAVP